MLVEEALLKTSLIPLAPPSTVYLTARIPKKNGPD
jgi:hypothetical protein